MRITIITIRKYLSPRDMGKVHEIMGPVAARRGGRGAGTPTLKVTLSGSEATALGIKLGASKVWNGSSVFVKPPGVDPLSFPTPDGRCQNQRPPGPPAWTVFSTAIVWKIQYVDIYPSKAVGESVLKEPTSVSQNCISPPSSHFGAPRPVLGEICFIFKCGCCLAFHPWRTGILLAWNPFGTQMSLGPYHLCTISTHT